MTLSVKIIKPKRPFKAKVFTDEIKRALEDEGKEFKRLYEKVFRSWADRPRVLIKLKIHQTSAVVEIFPDLRSKATKIFFFLDSGTKIRWAVMSNDFKAKTKPNMVGSGPGRGGAVIVGRKAMQKRNIKPRRGIKARKFRKKMIRIRRPKFKRRVQNAMKIASKRVY